MNEGYEFMNRVVRWSETGERRLGEVLLMIDVSPAFMEVLGSFKACLEGAGRGLDDSDLVIAATAITLGSRLVTNDERRFARIEGLHLHNWVKLRALIRRPGVGTTQLGRGIAALQGGADESAGVRLRPNPNAAERSFELSSTRVPDSTRGAGAGGTAQSHHRFEVRSTRAGIAAGFGFE